MGRGNLGSVERHIKRSSDMYPGTVVVRLLCVGRADA